MVSCFRRIKEETWYYYDTRTPSAPGFELARALANRTLYFIIITLIMVELHFQIPLSDYPFCSAHM